MARFYRFCVWYHRDGAFFSDFSAILIVGLAYASDLYQKQGRYLLSTYFAILLILLWLFHVGTFLIIFDKH